MKEFQNINSNRRTKWAHDEYLKEPQTLHYMHISYHVSSSYRSKVRLSTSVLRLRTGRLHQPLITDAYEALLGW
jgi:hypothetical protein